jgi:uncharacterized protein YutE (UPF0331/DUF86 family)
MNDVVINKVQTLQRCVLRAREEVAAAGGDFASDATRQDASVMNVVRACEATIDLANHLIRRRRLGVPNSSGEAFRLLAQAGVLDPVLAERMLQMTGYRNVAVHAYQKLDLQITLWVISSGLDDLLRAADQLRRAADAAA